MKQKRRTPVLKLKGAQRFSLDANELVKIHDLMLKARILEERLIKMYKQSDGYFWIGGPGEEAFNVPLGLQVDKGEGLDHDFLHLHYRSSAILLAMGILEPMDAVRMMKNTATDPFSGGRNFINHFSFKRFNVAPISSPIEVQYAQAIGTGIAHRRHGGTGLTIVNGGDAGSAEGEFASCLIWSSRPQFELPILIIVMNNGWGISTHASTQHGERTIADRAKAFGIQTAVIDGNDVETSYQTIRDAMQYIRTERRPFFIEARVSRLYGHSSASGANFVSEEKDALAEFEKKLVSGDILSPGMIAETRQKYEEEMLELWKRVKEEPMPDPATIYDHTYFGQKGRYW